MAKKKTRIRNKLDKLWADAVKENGHCEKCGKTSYLNAHHIYSRSALSTRWDLDNGICLCSGCHTLNSAFSAHKTPMEFTKWVVEKRGEEWEQRLSEKHNQIVKYSIADLEEMIECMTTAP